MQFFKKQKGFTLIELLIVIAIIGLLASIVLVGLNQFRSRARDTRRVADLRTMQNQLEGYFASNALYPGTAGDVATALAGQPGMSDIPNDPLCPGGAGACGSGGSWQNYQYDVNTAQTSYILKALMENNNPTTEDSSVKGATGFPNITTCGSTTGGTFDPTDPVLSTAYDYCVSI